MELKEAELVKSLFQRVDCKYELTRYLKMFDFENGHKAKRLLMITIIIFLLPLLSSYPISR